MKNLISAAGALSLGAASLAVATKLCAAEGGDKPWTASATLQGFYDDNIYTSPKAVGKVDSWGFDLSPSLGYARTVDNTSFSVEYKYSARWFEARSDSKWDQNHTANLKLDHSFSPRLKLELSDDFVSAQNPEQFAPLSGLSQRAEGDNINNSAAASLSAGINDRLTATLGYSNGYYDYDFALYAVALNRMEHLPSVDFRYAVSQATALGVGYRYGVFDYDTAGRDYNSHYVYAGLDHKFAPNFAGSIKVGGQVTDYDAGSSSTTPYVDGSLTYSYAPGSQASVGVRHTMIPTDVVASANQETTAFWVNWSHAFTAKLNGGLHAMFQSSDFNGGTIGIVSIDGLTENYWTLGASASYSLTPHVALKAAYHFDHYDSDLDGLAGVGARGYGRNRVFAGVEVRF